MSRDKGKTFLEGVIAKLPEEKRAIYSGLLTDPDAVGVLEEIGAGVSRQSDYSRNMDALRAEEARVTAWHQQLTDWHNGKVSEFTTKEQALADREAALAANPNPNPAPADGDPAVSKTHVTREELDQFSRSAAYTVAQLNDVSMGHYAKFGETLSMQELLQRPEVIQHGLEAGYRLVFKEKLDAHATAEQKKRDDALRAEGRAAAETELAGTRQLPYPTQGQDSSGIVSPLDSLTPTGATDSPNMGVVDRAVNAFYDERRKAG